jgi:hypothetical protein
MRAVDKGKRSTNQIGAMSEAAIVARFIQLGYTALMPYGGKQRYDLVIENDRIMSYRGTIHEATRKG